MVNATTGAAMTGLTVAGFRVIDGGTQAAVSGAITEKGNGQYQLAAAAADLNGDQVGLLFTATGAIPVHVMVHTTGGDFRDAVRFGLTALPNSAHSATGGLPTVGTGTGQIDVVGGRARADVAYVAGSAMATPNVAGYLPVDVVKTLGVDVSAAPDPDVLHAGTLAAASAIAATTITLAAGASATNDAYKGARVRFKGGTGYLQIGPVVTAYNGSTKVATLDRALILAVATDTTYDVVNAATSVSGLLSLDSGTAAAGGSATTFTATGSGLSATAGAYDGQPLLFTSGALKGQQRTIQSYTVPGGVKTFAFATGFTAAPAAGDIFVVG